MTKKQAAAHIPSMFGDFDMVAFTDDAMKEHIAFVHRDLDTSHPVTLRMHSECITGDLFGSARCDCGEQFRESLKLINRDKGVLLYLRQEGRGIGLINKLKAYNLQDQGLNTIDANLHLGLDADARTYDTAVDMMKNLGITKIRLITNNPEKIRALDESDIEVVSRVPIIIPANKTNEPYLDTKRDLMGHLL